MENKQIVLKLILDELGMGSSITTIDDRKRVQKAIYLSQIFGVNLGYRFSFYLMGPYSTSLTQDYYKLNEAIKLGDESYKGKILKDELSSSLESIKLLLRLPSELSDKITPTDWLEVIASLDYLLRVSKLDKDKAFEYMRRAKPKFSDYLGDAYNNLTKYFQYN